MKGSTWTRNSLGRASWPSWLQFIEAKLPWECAGSILPSRSCRRGAVRGAENQCFGLNLGVRVPTQPGGGALRQRCIAISARQS